MHEPINIETYVRRLQQKIKNTPTRTYAASDNISYPPLFTALASDQKRDVKLQLQRFPQTVQQSILAEWQSRCLMHAIRNPAAYLFGIIKKAKAGEFRATKNTDTIQHD